MEWKVGEWHWCKVTNREKDNFGLIVRVYRSTMNQECYFTKDCDDWYEERYDAKDIVVTDSTDYTKSTVEQENDEYWNDFTNNTAREVLLKLLEVRNYDSYEKFASEAVLCAKELTKKLKK